MSLPFFHSSCVCTSLYLCSWKKVWLWRFIPHQTWVQNSVSHECPHTWCLVMLVKYLGVSWRMGRMVFYMETHPSTAPCLSCVHASYQEQCHLVTALVPVAPLEWGAQFPVPTNVSLRKQLCLTSLLSQHPYNCGDLFFQFHWMYPTYKFILKNLYHYFLNPYFFPSITNTTKTSLFWISATIFMDIFNQNRIQKILCNSSQNGSKFLIFRFSYGTWYLDIDLTGGAKNPCVSIPRWLLAKECISNPQGRIWQSMISPPWITT